MTNYLDDEIVPAQPAVNEKFRSTSPASSSWFKIAKADSKPHSIPKCIRQAKCESPGWQFLLADPAGPDTDKKNQEDTCPIAN